MTTQTLYSDKKIGGNMSIKYFLGEFKRSWPKMVLYFVIFMLTMVVPLLMNNMGIYNSPAMTREENILACSTRLLNFIKEYVQIWTPMSMIVAVFSGCYVTKILNNKVSADFYHSIPMRRESIFLTRLTVGFVTYFVTFFVTVLTVLILCETQTLAEGYGLLIFKQILSNLGYSLLAFFMIYSTTVFAGMLCGITPMQLIMTLYLNLAIFVYYCSIFLTLEMFMDNFDAIRYLEDGFVLKLVPFVRFMALDFLAEISAAELWFYSIGSLLLFIASAALYKFRRIEKAGSPVVFDGFEAFFRYSVIIPVTLLGGLFFELLVGDAIWYYIGLVIASILCFMLINTILSKNARKMFKGIKGFGIYAVVMIIVFCAIGFDFFGIDSYIPNPDNIKSVNITLTNEIVDIDFKDKDVIKAAIALDRSSGEDSYGVEESADTSYDCYYYTTIGDIYSFKVVYTPKYGLPLARSVNVYMNSEKMKNFAKAVADSDDYEEYYTDRLSEKNYRDYNVSYDMITEANYSYYSKSDFEIPLGDNVDKALEALNSNFESLDYSYFQRQQIGKVYFYGNYINDYKRFEMPIYIDDEFADGFIGEKSIEEYYDFIAGKIERVVICKGNVKSFTEADDNVLIVEDKDKIKDVLRSVADLTNNKNIFTATEPMYHVGILYTYSTDSSDEKSSSSNHFTTQFLADNVPAFVIDSFK